MIYNIYNSFFSLKFSKRKNEYIECTSIKCKTNVHVTMCHEKTRDGGYEIYETRSSIIGAVHIGQMWHKSCHI